jgi:hypothetical protein
MPKRCECLRPKHRLPYSDFFFFLDCAVPPVCGFTVEHVERSATRFPSGQYPELAPVWFLRLCANEGLASDSTTIAAVIATNRDFIPPPLDERCNHNMQLGHPAKKERAPVVPKHRTGALLTHVWLLHSHIRGDSITKLLKAAA